MKGGSETGEGGGQLPFPGRTLQRLEPQTKPETERPRSHDSSDRAERPVGVVHALLGIDPHAGVEHVEDVDHGAGAGTSDGEQLLDLQIDEGATRVAEGASRLTPDFLIERVNVEERNVLVVRVPVKILMYVPRMTSAGPSNNRVRGSQLDQVGRIDRQVAVGVDLPVGVRVKRRATEPGAPPLEELPEVMGLRGFVWVSSDEKTV